MEPKTQHAIAAAGFVTGIYGIFVGATIATGAPMPNGELFAGVLVAVGLIFGFKLRELLPKK